MSRVEFGFNHAGVSEAEVKAESERAQLQLPLKGPKPTPVRQGLPADLPRIEHLITCEPQECVCGACGQEKVVIGYESAEQLDVEPVKYFVRVTKREKRACPRCPERSCRHFVGSKH
jgi:transposase